MDKYGKCSDLFTDSARNDADDRGQLLNIEIKFFDIDKTDHSSLISVYIPVTGFSI